MEDDQKREYAASFAAQLRARRIEAGMTNQLELAELVGVSEATYGRWERGTQLPDLWELREICRILGIEPHELLYPEPLTERERLLARRAMGQARRSLGAQAR